MTGRFQGVPDTLFIPLAARIFASERFPEYFHDEKALTLRGCIADGSIARNSSEYAFMASVARYENTDAMTKAFIQNHPRCNIIYLGAGLETAYSRLNGPALPGAMFYQVDLPEVIAARRELLGTGPNEVLTGGDMFAMKWAQSIDAALPSLLIASGVFQYFAADKVKGFVRGLRGAFADAELIFDATNETGLTYANNYVRKTGNEDALMQFCINDSAAFARSVGAELIEARPFFGGARKRLRRQLKLYTRIAMRVVDDKKRAVLVHLRLNPR